MVASVSTLAAECIDGGDLPALGSNRLDADDPTASDCGLSGQPNSYISWSLWELQHMELS